MQGTKSIVILYNDDLFNGPLLRQPGEPLPETSCLCGYYTTFYCTMLCICGTSDGPVSVCLCLSVTSRSSTKTAKRSITQTTPHNSPGTLTPKISAKFDQGHPLQGRQMQVGWVKISDFRQISGYILKTAKNRHIVSIKVE